MPLVAHNNLPSFGRLELEGRTILSFERARDQDIRELHIGLLNMMPDAALAATERQFFRLVGESNPIAQIYMHPFTLDGLPRDQQALDHIATYYESFESIKKNGLDALIITGANVTQPHLSLEPFWDPLIEVVNWAHENVTSILCSCLATHAVLEFRHGEKRVHLPEKRWGVFSHHVIDRTHPLVKDVNTKFNVPHSRFNDIAKQRFDAAGLSTLVKTNAEEAHMAVSEDGFRFVFFQGHPEYDTVSLLKEYKREIGLFVKGERDYPPFPEGYFTSQAKAVLDEYQDRITSAIRKKQPLPEFPEALVAQHVDNTWHDTGQAIVGKWMGLVYQLTHPERHKPFMDHVDPEDPLNLKA